MKKTSLNREALMKSQKICILLILCFCTSLIQKTAASFLTNNKKKERQPKPLFLEIDEYEIKKMAYTDNIIHMDFARFDDSTQQTASFLMNYSDCYPTSKSTVYFSPILDKSNLKIVDAQHDLFTAITYGSPALFDQAIRQGASLDARNKLYSTLTFIMINHEGKIASWDDIQRDNWSHLTHSRKIFFGTNTFNWDIFDHTQRACNMGGIAKLLSGYPEKLSKEQKKTMREDLEQLQKEQLAIQEAQRKHSIPTFDVALSCDSINDNYCAYSTYDDQLSIKINLRKDNLVMGAATPITTWKYPYLDIDALAMIYAAVMSVNDSEGKKIANNFAHWKLYPFFKQHVVRYLVRNIEEQCYCDEPLLLDNLMILANNIIKHDGIENNKNLDSSQQMFFNALLGLCAAKVKDKTDKKYDWPSAHHTLVHMLLSKHQGKEFLKQLCSRSDYFSHTTLFKNLHISKIKPLLQQHLFRTNLAQILTHRGSPCKDCKPIAENIASYWKLQENKKFIEYYKTCDKNYIKKNINSMLSAFKKLANLNVIKNELFG